MRNELEAMMRRVAVLLYDLQIAHVWKVPSAMQQTPCDFFGMDSWGRAIAIECKQQAHASSVKVNATDGIRAHQWRALEQAHACGAWSFLVWQNGNSVAVLPFALLAELAKERKSIPWTGALPRALPAKDVNLRALLELQLPPSRARAAVPAPA